MGRVKDTFFREDGDQGADTWSRYSAQFEYAAYWCVRMLRPQEQIELVVPEGGDDVVVRRRDRDELHQVKTRQEGQGPWTTAMAYPIWCQQFSRRSNFRPGCHFYFVSNQIADNETRLTGNALGSLYRLKHLLDLHHEGQQLLDAEQRDWEALAPVVADKISDRMSAAHGESLDRVGALDLLRRTHVETDCPNLHYPNCDDDCCAKNLSELEAALGVLYPGCPPFSLFFLDQTYQRLLRTIYGKVRMAGTMNQRAIAVDDVLNCRARINPYGMELAGLDGVPGRTVLDKKAGLGGFRPPECQLMHRQRAHADYVRRQLAAEGREREVERLSMTLVDRQITEWRDVTATLNGSAIGPAILQRLAPRLPEIAAQTFPGDSRVDEQVCKGLLWHETDQCRAWWHAEPPTRPEAST